MEKGFCEDTSRSVRGNRVQGTKTGSRPCTLLSPKERRARRDFMALFLEETKYLVRYMPRKPSRVAIVHEKHR
jgi:hypothetical protein